MRISLTSTVQRMALVASLVALGASLASAHHSAAAFDTSTEKVLTGTVKKVNWTNPHTWIWIEVPNGKGGTDTWGIEGMSPNYLARRGWTRNTLKVGDKLSVTIHPMRDGETGGMFMSAKRPDGEVLTMVGGAITDP
jgi:Family of unknown function (DUF6152)